MAGGKTKKVRAGSVWERLGDNAMTRRSIPQVVGNILQGGVTSNITVWFGDLGPFGGNG